MELTNAFDVPAGADETFAALLDVEKVMGCFPGAELLEVVDATTYRCKVAIRLGPIGLSFTGTATIGEIDRTARRARLLAKGSDAKGRGGADAVVRFSVEPNGAVTRVDVHSSVNLTGTIAQYGRGAGIIGAVAAALTAQFAQRLGAMLSGERAPAPPS
jgi:uncharacterized protein